MTDPETAPTPDTIPVVVSSSPLPAALFALVRQALLTACGAAVAKGWFGQSVADQLIPIGIALATVGYGQAKSWLLHSKAAWMADLLPDSQARTR